MSLPDLAYGSLDVHRRMLRDTVRTDAYQRAISAVVRPGDVVLDFGAGTGILSIFAAQAGARRVYAVERSAIVRVARRIVGENGLADRVTVLEADIRDVSLPGPVDVIVSEWLGYYGVDENLLQPLLQARDRWLKPGGRMVPATVTTWVAPLSSTVVGSGTQFWASRPYGVDLAIVGERDRGEVLWEAGPLDGSELVADPAPVWTVDPYTYASSVAALPFRAEVTFEARRHAELNALTAWFRADVGPGIVLSNEPGAPATHWGNFLFPLNRPQPVAPGDRFDVRFSCTPSGPGTSHSAWSVRVGAAPWEDHDTAGPSWNGRP